MGFRHHLNIPKQNRLSKVRRNPYQNLMIFCETIRITLISIYLEVLLYYAFSDQEIS